MDKKYFNKHESSSTADKHEFIGKKRHESSSDHYSKDRNSSHFRSDYDKSKHSQSNYSSAQNDGYQGSSYYSQRDDQSYYDHKNKYYSNSSSSNLKYNKYHSSSGQSQNPKPYSNSAANYSLSPPSNSNLPSSSAYSNANKKSDFSDEKLKNHITSSGNQNSSSLASKPNANNYDTNGNTYQGKSPDKASSYSQSHSSGWNQTLNQSSTAGYYNSTNYYNSSNNASNSNKYNMPGNAGITNSNAYNQNTSSNYGNYSQSGLNQSSNQGSNLSRQYSSSSVNNQNFNNSSNTFNNNLNNTFNTNNYAAKSSSSQNSNYYPNQAQSATTNANSSSNPNQGWFSNKHSQQNVNNFSNNNNYNNINNINQNTNNNENFYAYNNHNQENPNAPLSEENEFKQMLEKHNYHSDHAKLAKDFLLHTSDKRFYLKLRAKLDIKENLLAEEEADLLKPEEIEKVTEKKIFEKFVAEKTKESLLANKEIKDVLNNKDKKEAEDICIEIPIETSNNTINKHNKIIEDEYNKKDESVKMEEDIPQEKQENKPFHELLGLEDFERFFVGETNLEYNRYLKSQIFYSYASQNKEPLNIKQQAQKALEPSFLLSYVASNSKNRKLEKFLKENFRGDKLEAEKAKFSEYIVECEKADHAENEKKDKIKSVITDEEQNQTASGSEIGDEMLKFNFVNLPFHFVQEELPKEIKEIEFNAKKIKSEIYNCENSLTKIFAERLEIRKKMNKLVAKVTNNQEIKSNLSKYKVVNKLG